MIRGERLHKALFAEPLQPVVSKEIGRSKEKIKLRNEALIDRYYYYSVNTKWGYETLVLKVSDEFYLSGSMVGKILAANVDEIIKLKKEKPPLSLLKSGFQSRIAAF